MQDRAARRRIPDPHRAFVETLHSLDVVVWEMDVRTWRFTHVSDRAERLFGYPVEKWYEEPAFWQDWLLHPDDRQWCVRFCASASAAGFNHAFIYRVVTADARVRWIKDVVRVIPDGHGGTARLRGVMLDVTDEVAESLYVRGSAIDYDAPELEALRAVLAA